MRACSWISPGTVRPYPDFINKPNRAHPRFGDTHAIELEAPDR
jgi:hypothetical protein